jgi:LacI family transcriptional regulator
MIACQFSQLGLDDCRRGRDAWRALLKVGLQADAVLCPNDDWAMGMLAACAEAGLRVPQDVAVTGFDGMRYAQYGTVPLTTAAQPLEEMARYAVDLLVRMIHGHQPAESEMRVSMPCRIVVRNSTGGVARSAEERSIKPKEGSS